MPEEPHGGWGDGGREAGEYESLGAVAVTVCGQDGWTKRKGPGGARAAQGNDPHCVMVAFFQVSDLDTMG